MSYFLAGATVVEPAADAKVGDAGKDDVHPVASQAVASSPAPVGGTGSPGMPAFPLASVAVAVATMGVAVGGANHSVTSSAGTTLRACSFLSGGFGPEVPQEVIVPLSTADEALRRLWEALKEVGQAVEPGFKV